MCRDGSAVQPRASWLKLADRGQLPRQMLYTSLITLNDSVLILYVPYANKNPPVPIASEYINSYVLL